MARIAALMELQLADRPRLQNAGNDQGHDAAPHGGVLVEQMSENRNLTPQEAVLQRIASLPRTRQDKVLDIRRRIAEGTYEVDRRLNEAIDRVLAALTA
jgi:anti-sigma28 factor (negative regulator of flagellin synthesis)